MALIRNGRYRVGHDAGETNGTLKEYLALKRPHEVKKLWLDNIQLIREE